MDSHHTREELKLGGLDGGCDGCDDGCDDGWIGIPILISLPTLIVVVVVVIYTGHCWLICCVLLLRFILLLCFVWLKLLWFVFALTHFVPVVCDLGLSRRIEAG